MCCSLLAFLVLKISVPLYVLGDNKNVITFIEKLSGKLNWIINFVCLGWSFLISERLFDENIYIVNVATTMYRIELDVNILCTVCLPLLCVIWENLLAFFKLHYTLCKYLIL